MVDAFDYVRARGDMDGNDTGLDPFEYANAEGYDDDDDAGAYDDDDDDAAFLGGVVRGIGKAAKGAVKGIGKAAKGAVKGVGKAAKTVGKTVGKVTNNPLWKIAQTGASFIPGVGSAVSAGMASAAAIGRGASIQNIGLAAARGALPAPAAAAMDVAVGALKGHRLDAIALRTIRNQVPGGAAGRGAFDAGVALATKAGPTAQAAIRSRLSPAERTAFDKAVSARPRTPPKLSAIRPSPRATIQKVPLTVRTPNIDRPFPALNANANRAASMMIRRPELRAVTPARISAEYSVPTRDVRSAIAEFLRRFGSQRVHDARDVGEFETFEQCAQRHGCPVPSDLAEWPSDDAGAIEAIRLPPVGVSRAMLRSLYARGDDNIKRGILAHELLAHVARNTGELEGTSWRIKSGDVPYKVAQKLTGDANRWREIPTVNPGMAVKTVNGVTQLVPWKVGNVVQLPPGWFPSAVPAPGAIVSATGGPPFPAPSEYPAGYPSSVYVIRAGDTGEKVAARITGQPGRWRELLATNPKLASATHGISLYTGKSLALPSSWVKPQATPVTAVQAQPAPVVTIGRPPVAAAEVPIATGLPGSPPPVPPFTTGGAPVPPGPTSAEVVLAPPPAPATVEEAKTPLVTGSAEQIGVVQLMLAAFFRTHPEARYAFPGSPFGSFPEDLAGVWSERTSLALAGFCEWWNARGRSPTLPRDGLPDGHSIAALLKVTSEDGGGFDVKAPIQLAVRGIPQTPATAPASSSPPSGTPAPSASTPTPQPSKGGGDGLGALVAIGLPLLLASL